MAVFGILVVFISSTVLPVNAGGGEEYMTIWSYVGSSDIGPAHWSRNYTLCGGAKQSPVNIFTEYTKYHISLGKLKLKNYDYVKDDVYFLVKNRNTDIEFLLKTKDGGHEPQEVEFQGTTYRFHQFHFHWGSRNSQGSEHLLDWQEFAGEMHMIHYNTKYDSIHEAASKSDGLLVWGHFLKVTSEAVVINKNLQTLLSHFGKAKFCCNATKIPAFSLYDLLPKEHGDFYHYSGSLTTPPCYESVTWIVDRNPILVNEEQMKTFRSLKDNAGGEVRSLVDHFRPPQALNNREIRRNFDFDTESSAVVINKSNIMFASSVIVATMMIMLS